MAANYTSDPANAAMLDFHWHGAMLAEMWGVRLGVIKVPTKFLLDNERAWLTDDENVRLESPDSEAGVVCTSL